MDDGRTSIGRGAAGVWLAATFVGIGAAIAGPVEVYRDGPRYCPRGVSAQAPRIDAAQAERIARVLLPDEFCGPTRWVAGCDVELEQVYDSWRVYVHQYRQRPRSRDWGGVTHTYVILDAVGNCLANIPGTEPGAPR